MPFLDKNVAEFSYRIPQQFKWHDGERKYILKELSYEYIPKELLNRPKQGFGIPYNKWLHGPLKNKVLEYSNETFLKQQGIFSPKKTNSFIDKYMASSEGMTPDYSDVVWAFLMLQIWIS